MDIEHSPHTDIDSISYILQHENTSMDIVSVHGPYSDSISYILQHENILALLNMGRTEWPDVVAVGVFSVYTSGNVGQ